jgi:hypothetical protein
MSEADALGLDPEIMPDWAQLHAAVIVQARQYANRRWDAVLTITPDGETPKPHTTVEMSAAGFMHSIGIDPRFVHLLTDFVDDNRRTVDALCQVYAEEVNKTFDLLAQQHNATHTNDRTESE